MSPDPLAPVPTVIAEPDLRSTLPFPPTPRRIFNAYDTLAVFAEIYVNGSRAKRQLDISCTISNDAGEIVFREHAELLTEDSAASCQVSVPLDNLRPGSYVLSAEALEDENGLQIGRRVPFQGARIADLRVSRSTVVERPTSCLGHRFPQRLMVVRTMFVGPTSGQVGTGTARRQTSG